MSYTLFLLLNINHDKEGVLGYISQKLEVTGSESFCFDQSPESFFTVEYMHEGTDTSLALDIPYGAEERVMRDVLDFMTYLESYIQFQVLDPQLGRLVEVSESHLIVNQWKKANEEALQQYTDGHHFLRTVAERDGKKSMIEAVRFKEETWQNHCSVALAYNRIQNAGKALQHFQRAYELDPENTDILHAIGISQYNLQKYSEARETFLKYLELNPKNEDAREIAKACETKLKS
jgi:tetratricopeptide (TPR) repeat protein